MPVTNIVENNEAIKHRLQLHANATLANKNEERAEIERQTREFLARGGKTKRLESNDRLITRFGPDMNESIRLSKSNSNEK